MEPRDSGFFFFFLLDYVCVFWFGSLFFKTVSPIPTSIINQENNKTKSTVPFGKLPIANIDDPCSLAKRMIDGERYCKHQRDVAHQKPYSRYRLEPCIEKSKNAGGVSFSFQFSPFSF